MRANSESIKYKICIPIYMDCQGRPLLLAIFMIGMALFASISFSQGIGGTQLSNGPVNVTITNFSMPNVVGLNAPLTLFLGLQNSGGLASGNITITMNVVGPSSSFSRIYNASPLSPFQNESLVISMRNSTFAIGNYTSTIIASYPSSGSEKSTTPVSNKYTVVSVQPPQNSMGAPIMQTQNLSITYIPLYTALFLGKESVSQIGIKDTGISPEFVNISINSNYSSFIALSSTSIYLQPGQGLDVQFLLRSQNISADIATYTIPIMFGINPVNGKSSNITENIYLTIANRSSLEPRLLNEVTLTNSSNSTTGRIEIQSGMNQSINNATLTTTFPLSVANSSSQITTYGLQGNVTKVDDSKYKIYWSIPYLPPGQITYAYYKISNPQSLLFPLHIQNLLIVPSILKPINILKIINFSLPTFYTNSSEKISVDVLYTGTASQKVYFYLTAPPGITVYNSTQIVNATPNQLLHIQFGLVTNKNPGTLILTLYVNTQGANTTYSLPLVVLQNSGSAPTTTIRAGGGGTSGGISGGGIGGISGIKISQSELQEFGEGLVAIILIVLLIYGVMVIKNRPRYSRDRAKRLLNIRDQIKRQGEVVE